MKLLPQYSLRLMLTITTLVAGVFSITGLAARGHDWAIGVSVGVLGLAMAFVTYAVFFGILWVFSLAASPVLNRRVPAGPTVVVGSASPFVDASRQEAVVESAVDAIVVEAKEADGTVDTDGEDRPT